ncbi:MAG TPA: protein kinase [Candidatus Acidoferrales bacterium]|nr:protein kinase [Candidatus Acidoferrales bacterium]
MRGTVAFRMIGQKLAHYRILEKVGAGGMGEVYRAHDEQLDRDVALKVLPAHTLTDDNARARLLREARAAAALNHPHICTIHEVGEADGQAYIAMELIEGRPLSEVIPRGGLPTEQVLRYGSQIAGALAHAHDRGIVHRDLKSNNVVITPEGRAKVLDFGLAKRLLSEELVEATQSLASLTQPGAVLGTLPYMAPEQLRGQAADARSDVWALGVVLHEMLSGQRPFQGHTGYELSSAILNQAPEPLPTKAPVELRAVIERCLAKEPGHRYQRAGEVRAALEAIATGAAVPGRQAQHRAKRRWVPAMAVVVFVVFLLAALVGLNVGGLRNRLFGPATPKIESLAVLPLENLSGDPEQEYFADGMTEALITEFSKISALKIISRTSVMRYKKTDKPMPQIARELNVDGVVEGSVLREGDQMRITVQLIHGPSDKHLWAESYQRELRGVLALQSEVARAIASQVRVTVTPREQARLASAHAVNPKAYEAYLLGRHYWNQRTIHGYEQAVDTFRKAVDQDPGYAPAYAGLADSYILLGEQGGLPQKEARSLAEAAIRKALELDDNMAEAHDSLGWWKFHYEWNWAEAEQAFQRAIELNPGDAVARARYGRSLGFLGRFPEAIRELQRAGELDPLSIPTNAYLGQVYLFAKRYDEAAEQMQRTSELNPNHPLIRHNLGELYLAQGRFAEAIPELERSVELSGHVSELPSSHYLAILACAYARAKRREDAVKILNGLKQRSRQNLVSAFDMASLFVALGEKEQALAWLEQGYQQRDIWLVELKAWPWLDSLQDDPRYRELMRRMNFPE